MASSSTTCSPVLAAFIEWGRSLKAAKESLEEFAKFAKDEDYQLFTDSVKSCQRASEFVLQTVVYQGVECSILEKLALEMIKASLETKGSLNAVSTNGRITTLWPMFQSSQKSTETFIFYKIFTALKIFHSSDNSHASLPELPDSLEMLICERNHVMEKLTELPRSLIILSINFSRTFTTLPELPKKLQRLYCDYTDVKQLPSLPGTLMILNVQNSKLEDLPDLPDSLTVINILGTPAVDNKDVIAKLKAFKDRNPSARITPEP